MKLDDLMQFVSPRLVLEQVAKAIPENFKNNVIVIGSLAAGYCFLKEDSDLKIRTKDVDCLLSPRVEAIRAGRTVANLLFAEHWQLRDEGAWGRAGTQSTPEADLPILRLHPPGSKEWFIELLTVPESEEDSERQYIRLETSKGHFSLCSFGFLSLAEYQPISTHSVSRSQDPK